MYVINQIKDLTNSNNYAYFHIFDRFMFKRSVIDVNVTVCFCFVFKCLNATIPLTCTLANEYTSSNEISKKNSTVRGDCIASDALF